VVGAEADAVAASDRLLASGIWVPPIRPPTVAPGTCRLRITLSAIHTDDQVARLVAGLAAAGLAAPGACAP
jgi:8-amino-7-oxononanoate synthase